MVRYRCLVTLLIYKRSLTVYVSSRLNQADYQQLVNRSLLMSPAPAPTWSARYVHVLVGLEASLTRSVAKIYIYSIYDLQPRRQVTGNLERVYFFPRRSGGYL